MNKIVLFAIISSFCASAQSVSLSLDECIDIALENNYSVITAKLEAEKAETLVATAFDVPQTAITLSQDATAGGSLENGVTFSQDFEFPTVYISRHKALKAEAEMQRLNLGRKKCETLRDVTAAYCRLAYSARCLELLAMQDSLYKRFVEIATIKFNAGETSRLEKMNAERLYNDNIINLRRAENDYISNAAELQRLLGVDVAVSPPGHSLLKLEADIFPSQLQYDNTSAGLLSQQLLNLSEKNLDVAKSGWLPGISVGATVQALIKGFNPYHIERQRFGPGNFMGFEVGITVPLFFGAQRAKVKAASRDVEIARNQFAQNKAEADTRYAALLNEFITESRALEYYESEALTEAVEIERIARVSYELGEIGYMEYVQNLEAASSIRMSHAETLNRYNLIVNNINFLLSTE